MIYRVGVYSGTVGYCVKLSWLVYFMCNMYVEWFGIIHQTLLNRFTRRCRLTFLKFFNILIVSLLLHTREKWRKVGNKQKIWLKLWKCGSSQIFQEQRIKTAVILQMMRISDYRWYRINGCTNTDHRSKMSRSSCPSFITS